MPAVKGVVEIALTQLAVPSLAFIAHTYSPLVVPETATDMSVRVVVPNGVVVIVDAQVAWLSARLTPQIRLA